MKQYKVIKEFGCAQKGDILKENEAGLFELIVECDCNDMYSSRAICISSDIADTLVSAEYLAEIEDEEKSVCDKTEEVLKFVNEKLEQYEKDHDALLAEYNEGNLPQCVKVEADTVYFNLNKVLTAIKDIIEDEQTR